MLVEWLGDSGLVRWNSTHYRRVARGGSPKKIQRTMRSSTPTFTVRLNRHIGTSWFKHLLMIKVNINHFLEINKSISQLWPRRQSVVKGEAVLIRWGPFCGAHDLCYGTHAKGMITTCKLDSTKYVLHWGPRKRVKCVLFLGSHIGGAW